MIIELQTYVHGSKDNDYANDIETAYGVKLSDKMKSDLTYINYEIELLYQVDTEKETLTLIQVGEHKIDQNI